MAKKDKYACFQWIRDVRDKMNRETEGMTLEERVAYHNAKGDEALRKLPKMTPEERARVIREALYPEETSAPPQRKKTVGARKPKSAQKPAGRKKTAKRPVHA